jgi:hypothetical protein
MSVALAKQTFASLNEHLASGQTLPIEWTCQYCYKNHKGDLLKKVQTIRISTDDKQILQLLGVDDNLFAVIAI